MSIKARISFKLLSFMYNCFVGNASVYLTELLFKSVPGKLELRSLKAFNLNYTVPFTKRNTFIDISFSTIGPKLWNSLPAHIELSETMVLRS